MLFDFRTQDRFINAECKKKRINVSGIGIKLIKEREETNRIAMLKLWQKMKYKN
jgi:hypothetical protein